MKVTPLGSMIPVTVSTAPASRSMAPRRVRTARARRIRPITANSAPVRVHPRISLVRACDVSRGAPHRLAGPADELHTTRFCRCDRSLMPLAAAVCVLKCYAVEVLSGAPRTSWLRSADKARVSAGIEPRTAGKDSRSQGARRAAADGRASRQVAPEHD